MRPLIRSGLLTILYFILVALNALGNVVYSQNIPLFFAILAVHSAATFAVIYWKERQRVSGRTLVAEILRMTLESVKPTDQVVCGLLTPTGKKKPYCFAFTCHKIERTPWFRQVFSPKAGDIAYEAVQKREQRRKLVQGHWLIATPVVHPLTQSVMAVLMTITPDGDEVDLLTRRSNEISPVLARCLVTMTYFRREVL